MTIRTRTWAVAASLIVTTALSLPGHSQAPVAEQAWTAQWIADKTFPAHEEGTQFFRREFDLGSRPDRFMVRVSGDNRYRLYVNGTEVAIGPARGDILHWRYETIDLAPHLHAGRNVVAAIVWNWGELRPAAQTTNRTAFMMQGEGPGTEVVNSGPEWRVLASKAYSFAPVEGEDSGGFYVAGPQERLNAALYPWGWEQPGYDAGSWSAAMPISRAFPRGTTPFGVAAQWQLVPRSIPLPERRAVRFATLRRSEGIESDGRFLQGRGDLVIPPHRKVSLLLDQGTLTTGHPLFVASDGKDATLTMTYAEGLFDAKGVKGNRDIIDGKSIRGVRDRIIFDGGDHRHFQSLWLRAWRYVQLDIETADEPLRIHDLHSLFTAYPFQQKASFSSDQPWITPIWDMNWRSLRIGAFETYWDTPYYEQLQYVGDTRIESLLSLYQTGDDRLMRNAIEQFDDSRSSEGLTASAYPSSMRQQIPSFSLWWIAMVHDYWMLRDDPAFVRRFMPGIRDVIAWHERHIDGSGMLGPMPWWTFLDWSDAFKDGVPPGGGSTAFTLQFAWILRQAAELEHAFGVPALARHYGQLADRLIATTREKAWDDGQSLYADTSGTQAYSQQTNALALLADAIPTDRRQQVMQRLLSDKSLVQASYYFRFYVDEALEKTGQGDAYLDRLQPWQDMIANGLTTTAENPEPTRSDSHAWSAHPNYHLLATTLGIRPGSPGFRSVIVAPHPGRMRQLSGTMPHPGGIVAVRLKRQEGDTIRVWIDLPHGVPGEFQWKNLVTPLKSGRNIVTCTSRCVTSP